MPLKRVKRMRQKKYTAPEDLQRWVERHARIHQRSESSVIREALYALKEAS